MPNEMGSAAPRVFFGLSDEDRAMAAPLVQALRSAGVRLETGHAAEEDRLASFAVVLALVTPASLLSHSWRSAFLLAVRLQKHVVCLLHPDAALTPAMQMLLGGLTVLPFGPECGRDLLSDSRIAACIETGPRFSLLPEEGPAVPVPPSGLVIGRDPSCTLRLTDPSVSRFHARITFEDGVAGLTDTDSMNGTLLNGILLESGDTCEMETEDEILIGSCRFIFRERPAH